MKKITDKMRLDFLDSRDETTGTILSHYQGAQFHCWPFSSCDVLGEGKTARKSIDAAIRKASKEKL